MAELSWGGKLGGKLPKVSSASLIRVELYCLACGCKHMLLTLSSVLTEKIPPFLLVLEIHCEHGFCTEV